MSFESDLAAAYAAQAETVSIGTGTALAFFDGGYGEAYEVAGTFPSVRCIASDVSTVAAGDTVVRDSVTYTVRNLMPIAPDELETRLILERA